MKDTLVPIVAALIAAGVSTTGAGAAPSPTGTTKPIVMSCPTETILYSKAPGQNSNWSDLTPCCSFVTQQAGGMRLQAYSCVAQVAR